MSLRSCQNLPRRKIRPGRCPTGRTRAWLLRSRAQRWAKSVSGGRRDRPRRGSAARARAAGSSERARSPHARRRRVSLTAGGCWVRLREGRARQAIGFEPFAFEQYLLGGFLSERWLSGAGKVAPRTNCRSTARFTAAGREADFILAARSAVQCVVGRYFVEPFGQLPPTAATGSSRDRPGFEQD